MVELAFEIGAPELVRTKARGQRRSLRAAAALADMADQAVAIKDGVDGAAGGDPEITGKTADQQLADARVRPEHKPCGHPSAGLCFLQRTIKASICDDGSWLAWRTGRRERSVNAAAPSSL